MTLPRESFWRTGWHAVNGFSQFCREWQPPEHRGLPLLALHGSLTQSGMWIAPVETAGSLRTVCPDQRGFAMSEDPGRDACADFAADACALAQRLFVGRYVLVGHSFACSIALEAARMDRDRVAAVVLVDPVVRVGPPGSAAPSAPLPDSFATVEEAARHFRTTEEGVWTEDTLVRFVRDIMIHDPATGQWRFPYTSARLRRLRAFTASPASDYDLFAKARAVRAPVLIFRGGASTRFPAAAEPPFVAAFPSKPKLVLCPASGHFPTATEPAVLIEALTRFLDRIA